MGLETCGSDWNEPWVPDNPLGFPFSECCRRHDACYGNCNGPAKEECDTDFYLCMGDVCKYYPLMMKGYCLFLQELYYYAVTTSASGDEAFKNARAKCSACDTK
jgi:hypothetical protein